MRMLITGSAGFLGRHLVAEALRRGHAVRALVRPASDASVLARLERQGLDLVRADLRAPAALSRSIEGMDAVIHAAALKSGDLYDQFASTVVGTENLLSAMSEAGVRRIVLVSTISVYDFLHRWDYSRLDEQSPIERRPARRETYAQSKLLQEQLVRREAEARGLELTVVRPGFIYGPGNTWTDQLGVRIGANWWLRFASLGRLPLTYVENCAEAIVISAERPQAVGQTFNIVDSDLPTRRRFAREVRRRMKAAPRVVPVPAIAFRALARMAELANAAFFGGEARLPWILAPAKLHVQVKPLRYTNRHIRDTLGWRPAISFQEAMNRSLECRTDPGPVLTAAEQGGAPVAEGSA